MTKRIEGKTYDAERSLYHLRDTRVENCTFAGPADGESVLKECSHVEVAGCRFSLRYPLWHAHTFTLARSELDEGTRAPIWYAQNGRIEDCTITGVKCLRECDNVLVKGGTDSVAGVRLEVPHRHAAGCARGIGVHAAGQPRH